MNGLHHFTAEMSALAALVWQQFLHAPLSWKLAGLAGVGFFVALFTAHRSEHTSIVRLNGLSWSRDDFCRGWLITGDTGPAKLAPVSTNCCSRFSKMNRAGEDSALTTREFIGKRWWRWPGTSIANGIWFLLQVRPDNARSDWKPTQTYNLTSAPGIPFSTFAKFVVDSASSLGQQNDKGFFKSQVQTHLTLALELIYEIEGRCDAGKTR